jgi:hypothetical protein
MEGRRLRENKLQRRLRIWMANRFVDEFAKLCRLQSDETVTGDHPHGIEEQLKQTTRDILRVRHTQPEFLYKVTKEK